MASHFGGYSATTKTYTITDYYNDWWVKGVLTITVNANGNGSYTIKMTNDLGGKSWCNCSVVCYINGTKIIDAYYDGSYNPGFPAQNDSTKSGSFTVSGGSFEVKFSVCRSQAATTFSNSNRLTNGTATGIGGDGEWWETFTRTPWYWYDNTAGSAPKITDGENNKFSITGYSGTAGSNNSITETKLQYKFGSGSWNTATGNSLSATSITAKATESSQKISARTRYKCTRGGDDDHYIYSETAELNVKNYQSPSSPSNVTINYTKNRFTIKENWVITWDRSTATNDSSQVEGYRIRVLKNGSTIRLKDSSGTILATETSPGNKDYCYDFEDPAVTIAKYYVADDNEKNSIIPADEVASYDFNGNGRIDIGDSVLAKTNNLDRTFIIDPIQNEFAPGDTVKIRLFAYSRNGLGAQQWSSDVYSNELTVQNAGIMRVKVGGSWKEGQVHVKVNGAWKEAEVVEVKTSAGWKESE